MKRLASPDLTPTSQQVGAASDNSAALAPSEHAEIPVSSPRPQPTTAVEYQAGTWTLTESAGSA